MTAIALDTADLDSRPAARGAWVETAVVGLALAVLSNALIGPLFAPVQGTTPQAESLRVMWLPIYAVAVGVMLMHPGKVARIWPAMIVVGGLLAWAAASVMWSLDPETTQRRAIALVFTTLFGLMLAARYSWREFVRLLATVYGVLAVMSLLAVILFPAWAINNTTNPNDWKGLWYEKNALGANMALGGLAALSSAVLDRRRRLLWAAVLALEAFLIVQSRSATSLVGLMVGCAAVAGLALLRRGPVLTVIATWVAITGAGLLAAVAWLAPDLLLKALGKDPTLTGRTDIWASLLRRVEESPWLGYGYQAFWSTDRHGPAAMVRRETGWTVPSAHNGWLELLIQLGWVGVALFALNHVLTAGVAAVGAPQRRDGGFALVYVVVFGVFSLSESYLLQHNSMSWVLYVAVMAKLFQRAPAGMFAPMSAARPAPSSALAASGA